MDYPERRRAQARQTEGVILRTAFALMRERGFEKVSIRDICQAAGITTGAFYHHFSAKEDLFTRGVTPLNHYIERAVADCAGAPPLERLRALLTAYSTFIQEESGELTGRYYQRRMSDPKSRSFDADRFIHTAMLDCFEDARARGELVGAYDAKWLAAFCYRHFRGVVVDWVLHGYEYSLLQKMEEDYRLLERLFLPKDE